MKRQTKWLLGLGIPLALMAVAAAAVLLLIPSDEELARMAETRVSDALGVPVTIGALHWMLLPLPVVILQDVSTGQDKPVSAKRVVAYLHLRELLHRVVSVQSLEVDGGVVPQLSLKAFAKKDTGAGNGNGKGDAKAKPASAANDVVKPAPASALAGSFSVTPIPLEHLHFTNLTWISRRGIPVVYEGDIDFDEHWRPRVAQVRRPGVTPETGLTLTRHGDEDRWATRITVGGGTAHGEVRIKTDAKDVLHLAGELQPRHIEVQSAVMAFNRKPLVSGRASGTTVLDAEGHNIGQLASTLHSRTQFTVAPAKVLRFDLHKAIKTFGKEHDGTTPLESITGVMDTQNTGEGTIWTYSGLKATSGALTASGDIVIFNRKIEAKAAVDLVDGLVGVPIKVSGSMDKPDVSVPKGAIAGALIGTAILPVIGTAIGARLGALFSADPKVPVSRPQPAPKKTPPPAAQRHP
ncbi:MAG: hypothetical protein H7346_02080 [Burkholderiaceae bacterium]|nr:hypothetical protein [Burkholderiaceae bacterium]